MNTKKTQNGSILIFTILLLTTLSFVVWKDIHLSTLKIFKARFALNKLKSTQFAKSGYTLALSHLQMADHALNTKNSVEFSDGYCDYFITNEDGKLNLNHLVNAEGVVNQPYETIIKNIFKQFRINTNDLDILYDWIDEDNIERKNGAEQNYYERFHRRCKNNFLSLPSELFLLKNFDKLNKTVKAKEFKSYFTTTSNRKININSCPLLVLRALGCTNSTATNIIRYRTEKGAFTNIDDLKKVPGVSSHLWQQLRPIISIENNYFLIYSLGYYNKLKTVVESVVYINKNHNIKPIYYSESLG